MLRDQDGVRQIEGYSLMRRKLSMAAILATSMRMSASLSDEVGKMVGFQRRFKGRIRQTSTEYRSLKRYCPASYWQ